MKELEKKLGSLKLRSEASRVGSAVSVASGSFTAITVFGLADWLTFIFSDYNWRFLVVYIFDFLGNLKEIYLLSIATSIWEDLSHILLRIWSYLKAIWLALFIAILVSYEVLI